MYNGAKVTGIIKIGTNKAIDASPKFLLKNKKRSIKITIKYMMINASKTCFANFILFTTRLIEEFSSILNNYPKA